VSFDPELILPLAALGVHEGKVVNPNDDDEKLISASDVRRRYGGVSQMWIHRRLLDGSGFPRPVYIGALRFWRISELVAWEKTLPRANPKSTAAKNERVG
jgi:predicted DNA-binding transcriptional regulator AlpA